MQAQKPDDKGRSLVSIMLELGLGLRQAGGGEGVCLTNVHKSISQCFI